MSVPLHQTVDGLPVGVQFMAGRGREDRLFRIAAILEQMVNWIDIRKKPVKG
jgi:amidase